MSPSESLIYKYDTKTGKTDYSTIIGYGGASKDVVIPEEVNGVKVTTISSNAFASCGLNSVIIPDSVTTIGGAAFYNNNLTSVKLPSNLKYIGGSAFRANNVTKYDIPKSVTYIGNSAFIDNKCPKGDEIIYARNSDGTTDYSKIVSGCSGYRSNANLVIPAQKNGVKLARIVNNAFGESLYTSITLPNLSETNNLTIEDNAFYHNRVSGDGAFIYKVTNGKIDYSTLSSYAGQVTGTLTIPEESHGVKLKNIVASLNWKSFDTVVIPVSVEKINNSVITKTNRCNTRFVKIINKTGRAFNWYGITGSSHQNPGTFVTGTISHQSGDIQVTSS